MFTGIVEELGTVTKIEQLEDSVILHIDGPTVTQDAQVGASIACNGVCLTVTNLSGTQFCVDVMQESLNRSSLGQLQAGSRINLERAMAANGRFGGHIVQGHVDTTATIISRQSGQRWDVVRFTLPESISKYLVEKGSITIDGVSLTISALGNTWFEVSLIPTTLNVTTLGIKQPGDLVNLEADVLAKHVERLIQQ